MSEMYYSATPSVADDSSGGGNFMKSALQFVPALGGAIWNQVAGSVRAKKTRQHEKEMAEYAYEKNLEMWNRQNVYNSPEAQMARLQKAGLNPHLMYGKGTVGNATSMPQYQAPRQEHPHIPLGKLPAYEEYQNIRMRDAQIDNLEQYGKNLKQERALKKIYADLGKQKMDITGTKFSQYDKSYWQASLDQMASRIGLNKEQKKKLEKEVSWAMKKNQTFESSQINIDRDSIRDKIIMQAIIKMLENFSIPNIFEYESPY